jgi:hypothetical protein
MPTAAKLIAALGLALVAFVVSGQVIPLMPEGFDFGWFTHVNVVLGLVCGWWIIGPRLGEGLVGAIMSGLTGMAVLVFWALFVQACNEMVRLAMDRRLNGPFDAIIETIQLMFDYGLLIAEWNILATLVIGGALTGLAAAAAARRWR